MRIDSSGNVGIGVTPSAWSGITALQIVGSGAIGFNNQYGEIDTNTYYNSGYKYIGTGLAAKYSQEAGVHAWFNATSGTAGNAISFTERMRIDSSGNVGIGTASPGAKLTISQSAPSVAGGQLLVKDPSYSGVALVQGATGEGYLWNIANSYLSIGTNSTERMRITSAGLVGIGASSPQVGLHVLFSDQSTNRIRLQNTGASGGTFDIIGGLAGASNAGLSFFDVTNSATRMYIDSSGNVGIGTSSPGSLLQLNKASGAADLRLSVGGTLYSNIYASSSDVNILSITAIPLILGTNNTERMRIVSDGAVGMGTSAPNASLHVQGSRGGEGRMTQISTSAGSATDALNIMASSSSGGSDQWYSWGVTSGNVWRICPGVGLSSSQAFSVNSNSRVLVGSATAFDVTVGADFMVTATTGSAAAFYVGATSTTQISFYDSSQSNRVGWIGTGGSSTSYNTTSDRRLKRNIQPVGDVGDKIDQIEVVSHEWTNGTDAVIPYAFIAQDLYEAAPHAVSKGDDGEEVSVEWAVDYSKLVPMLVKEVQSLRARVAELEGK
jgi:hypothetical protein